MMVLGIREGVTGGGMTITDTQRCVHFEITHQMCT